MCFSGDEILMDSMATLGPIDPQINGVPAHSILKAFEKLEERLKNEGPDLSKELAINWLSNYMLKCSKDDERINKIVNFFTDTELHKSHGRSIDRETANAKDLNVKKVEEIEGFADLVRGLYNQYEMWFDKTNFYKMYENARGINWGRQAKSVTFQLPIAPPSGFPIPQPGSPEPSENV